MIEIPRGIWGWLVLGLVLLVPVFGFWKWWAGINVRQTRSILLKASPPAFARVAAAAQSPGLSPVKLSTAAGKPSSAPAVPGASPAPGATPISAAGAPSRSAASQQPSGRHSLADARSGAFAPGPASGSSAFALNAASQPAVALSTHASVGLPSADELVYNPMTDRDPTLSPAESAELKRMEEMAHQSLNKEPQGRRHEVRIETRLHLNGIVAVAENRSAIVNGHLVREHDAVLGARIRKITQTCVEFEYKKRTFSKCIKK